MTFKIYTDDGKVYGPYGSLSLAQKWARAKLAGNKLRRVVEIRPAVSVVSGGFGLKHKGSFYRGINTP